VSAGTVEALILLRLTLASEYVGTVTQNNNFDILMEGGFCTFLFFILKGEHMKELQAFQLGIKPTALFAEGQEQYKELLTYPHVPVNILSYRKQSLFFHTEKQKKEWINRTNRMDHTSLEFHKELGLVLGYPPLAVEFFIRRLKSKREGQNEEVDKMSKESIGLNYAGIVCNSCVDDLIENAKWLWDTYHQDLTLRVRFDTSYIPVEYRDTEGLRSLKKQLYNALGFVYT
jgi:hypothetical protein